MKNVLLISVVLFIYPLVFAQSDLQEKQNELEALREKEKSLLTEIEELKLDALILDLKKYGVPASKKELEIVEHSGFIIGFDCEYKLPSWAFHILTPDVTKGTGSRSNDFRPDPNLSCASAVEADYFSKTLNENGTYSYDGYGFDRGHLAPSADFSWSNKLLSESYFYSNMTPQRSEFNRESWVELEFLTRRIVDNEQKSLFIVTGAVLHENLPVIERSVNNIPIPELFYKIIVDMSSGEPKGMAFLMPNKKCPNRLSTYVVSIDSIEALTGINFFPKLNDIEENQIEVNADFEAWKTQSNDGDVEPMNQKDLPKGHFNTTSAAVRPGQTISVVGKVVSTKFIEKSQSTFLNLDQSFPHQVFSINIWKDGRRNFSYKPETELAGKYIVVTGKIELDKNGIPSVTITHERQIKLWE